jgi:hypothetical protein
MKMRLPALLGVWIAALVCGGCALIAGGPAKDTPRQVGPANGAQTGSGLASGGPTIRSAELDELTRAFADRYVGLLSSACDALTKDNPDLVQRREAQELLVNGATNVYDIASNADAFTRVLDLVVVTTLASQVWIDDDRAGDVFGDRAEVLVRALHHGREEAWALAAQVLRPDQLDLLDYLLWDWRRHNPDMARVFFVRFSNFAIGRGKSADAEVLAAGGLFGNVGQAGQAIEEARLLTERMFYMLKREPTLLRWQTEVLQDATLATPEVNKALADVHRLTDQAEQLPKNIAAERQALLAAFDDRIKVVDAVVTNVRGALAGIEAAATSVKGAFAEANGAVTSLGQTSNSFNEMLKTADTLYARFDASQRWSTAAGLHPFDAREFTQTAKELGVTASKVNDVLKSSNELIGSPAWDLRLRQVSEAADARIKVAAEESQRVVDESFRRVYVALGALCAMLILCLVTAFLLMRRIRLVVAHEEMLDQESGRTGRAAPPQAAERDGGGKGTSE